MMEQESISLEHVSEQCTCIGRWCTGCQQVLCFVMFAKDKSSKSGLQSQCRVCQSKRHAAWREKNRERYHQRQRDYRQAHKDEARAYQKKWQQKNPERLHQYLTAWIERKPNYRRDYYQAHREEDLARSKAWRQKNREYDRELHKRYRHKQAEHRRQHAKEYRRKNGPAINERRRARRQELRNIREAEKTALQLRETALRDLDDS